MGNEIKRLIEIIKKYSPKYFINDRNELIVEPKNNIYFRLEDIETELELKCKVIAWLSRPSCKGVSNYWQTRIRNIVNEFLGTNFTKEEMGNIYTYLGLDSNRKLTLAFIESNYDLSVLKTVDRNLDLELISIGGSIHEC